MSKIHYFQRYSSIENTVTNNTLQLFARIYEYSASAASSLLSDLTGVPVEIGVEIQQQQRGAKSVPDGSIIQRSFKILLEAKVDAPLDVEQLVNHARTFKSESEKKILLLLTKQSIGQNEHEAICQRIHQISPDIIFKNITFEEVCNAIKDRFREHEATMAALVRDYIEYCNDTELFDQSRSLLRIVPCGDTVALNRKYGIYFHPSDRGYTDHAFVGIYADRRVQTIWEIESICDVVLDGEILSKTPVGGATTDKYDQRLRGIIEDSKRECGYEIASGYRFFCGEPLETNFKKATRGGIWGARFVNLREIIGGFSDARDVAEKLRLKEWQ